MADDLKLKGPVREIGIERDHDRHDSFNITIGITIKTEGKVSYEEAERLSTKFRREYLGKDVEFRAIHIPCPHCDKILNSGTGLKQHILKIHPEKAELLTPSKVAAKVEGPEKKVRGRKVEKPAKKTKRSKTKIEKPVKAVKAGKAVASKKQNAKKERPSPKSDVPEPVRSRVKVEQYKPTPMLSVPSKRSHTKSPQKAKQLTLA